MPARNCMRLRSKGATCRKPGPVCLWECQWICLPFPKNAPFCSMPRSRDLQFNRRLTGCGVQRTRTLCFGDLSIGICLDYDALFGSDIDMGSFGIFGISLKAWARYAKGAEEKGAEDGGAVFKERMSNWALESRSYSAPDVSSVAWRRNSNA
mgnify:FL=1